MNTNVDTNIDTHGVKEHFKTLAKLGYAARGVIYLVIGSLALMTAFGEGGKTTDSKGAVVTIMQQPFGKIMLGVLILGLFGYSAWRFVQAIKDPDNHGTDAKGLAIRAGLLASAISHVLLAIWAIRLLMGDGSSSDSGGQSWITGTTIGQFVLGAAGVGGLVAGCAHIAKGWTARFERYMTIPADKRSWAQPLCRFGLIARGVVGLIVGWFLIDSAMNASSGDIKGMSDALASLRDNSYGPWLLGLVALGLMAFGVYSGLEALYRRIEPENG